MSAKLTDQRTGREHQLSEEGTTLGRHHDNDISLAGRSVSRFHAEIAASENGWAIEDHGSTYGTFVNGQKVEGLFELNDGDKVRLAVSRAAPDGEFNFLFSAEKPGIGTKIKKAARAIVSRKKVDLGKMVFERQDHLLIVRMSGIFRRREVDAFRDGTIRELGGQDRNIALDLTGVKYLNSYGLACMVKMATRQREKGRHLRAFGASGTVLKLLRLVGSESPIELVASQEEAIKP